MSVTRSAIHRLVAEGAWVREGPGVYRVVGAPRAWRLFMLLLDDAGLPEPAAEHWVCGDGWRYRLDLAYPGQWLAIELDGKDAHLNDAAFEADPVRDNRLSLAGWTVLHYIHVAPLRGRTE